MKQKQIINLYHRQLVKEIFPSDIKPKFKIGQKVVVKSTSDTISHKGLLEFWAIFDEDRQKLVGKEGIILEINYIEDEETNDKTGTIDYYVKFGNKKFSLCEEWLRKK